MTNEERIIKLLEENNAMLKEILRYIIKSNSSEEQQKRQLTSFAINVTANGFYEDLTEEEKNNLKKNWNGNRF
nr:MAG TPA: hypothetical protein [Bacteriophage sp.]